MPKMFHHSLFVVIVLCSTCIVSSFGKKFTDNQELEITNKITSDLNKCNVTSKKELNTCLKDLALDIRPYFPYGLRKWNVPALEPLEIKSLTIVQGEGAARIQATFNKLVVSGLSNYSVAYLTSNPKKYNFELGMIFPNAHIIGRYEIDGRILILPITGHGTFWAHLSEVHATAHVQLTVVNNILTLKSTKTDFNMRKLEIHLDNLFNGDKFLGNTVNMFLNENTEELLREFKPRFAVEVDIIIQRAFREAIQHLPLKQWRGALND